MCCTVLRDGDWVRTSALRVMSPALYLSLSYPAAVRRAPCLRVPHLAVLRALIPASCPHFLSLGDLNPGGGPVNVRANLPLTEHV